MIRTITGLLGALTAAFPDRMIDIFEAVAIDNPDDCPTRPRIRSGIRAEGIAVTVASLAGGRAFAWMMYITGAFGAVFFLFPRTYRTVATTLLYHRPHEVEWNGEFTDRVRLIGVLYVLLAAWTLGKRRAGRTTPRRIR